MGRAGPLALERAVAGHREERASGGDAVFQATGHAMAQAWGVPEYKFLAMPHPIANLTEAQLDQRAREIAPEIVKLLLQGQD